METIADRILKILEVNQIKKRDLARRLKISDSSVSTMCSGKSKPSGQTITMICHEFGVREEWLKDGKGEMFSPTPIEDSLLEEMLKGREITNEDRALVRSFLELSGPSREAVIQFVQNCAKRLNALPADGADSDAILAKKMAALERQNEEIMAQNRELMEKLEAMEKEDAEREQAEPVLKSVSLFQSL